MKEGKDMTEQAMASPVVESQEEAAGKEKELAEEKKIPEKQIEASEKDIEAIEIEDAELQKYMDPEYLEKEEFKEDVWISYLEMRYDNVQASFRGLACQLKEAQGMKNKESEAELTIGFKKNYKQRKYVVRQLRLLGKKIKDRHVPDFI